jgi:predicted transcriptional regulator
MKNITLSADEHLIERARQTAQAQHKTLNAAFREWLEQYVAQSGSALEYDEVMRRLSHIRAGRKYTRDEMNERR